MSFFAVAIPGGVLSQALQVLGAFGVLSAFAAAQLRILTTQSPVYLLLNLAGATLLAVLAAVDQQYGFLMLEGAWALVSAWGLLCLARARPPGNPKVRSGRASAGEQPQAPGSHPGG